MSISLNFELNDRDLAHFQEAMERSRKAAEGKSAQDIIDCAAQLLVDAQKTRIPDFILERLMRLDDMIAMVRDEAWAMSEEDKDRVLSALVYFCDPEDVIPDHVQVLGFLDDAVMIELSVREGIVTGTARALHVGRSTQVWEIRIEDAAGRLACVSRLTLAVVPRRAS